MSITQLPKVSPAQMELVYQSKTTRVFRLALSGLVCKEPLGPDAKERLARERETLGRLASIEGVARLAAAGAGSTMLPLYDGGTSVADILKGARIDVYDVLAIGIQLARVLKAVHRAGIIHGDICPANVLVRAGVSPTQDRHAVTLVDFDRSIRGESAAGQGGSAQMPSGTPGYAAPEQSGRTGRAIDERADLYALGATLYEMAAGQPAFEGTDELRLMHDNLVRDPPPLSQHDPGIPESLNEIILRLLAKDPQERYQSVPGLLHDLHRLREDMDGGRVGNFELGENDFPARLPAPSELVGREPELEVLRAAFTEAVNTPRHTVLIEGAPGIGKSALLRSLKPTIMAAGGWFLYGKFDQYQKEAAVAGAITQAVRALGNLLLALPKDELARQRGAILHRLGANAGLFTRMLPEFAALLGEQPEVATLDPRQAEQRLLQCTVDLLRAVASVRKPLVFAMDDLQWANAMSLRLLDMLINERGLRGLLVVGVFRSNEVDAAHPLHQWLQSWSESQEAPTRLALQHLSQQGVAELVGGMLRLEPGRASELGQAVASISAGNPFNTVELLNALRGKGILRLGKKGWQWDADAIRGFVGSGNVIDLLAARIDRLQASARSVIDAMSCLGGGLEPGVLQTATGLHGANLVEALQALQRHGMVTADDASNGTLHFRHDFVQQAVLSRMDANSRAHLQLALARRLAANSACAPQAAQQYSNCAHLLDQRDERAWAARLFLASGVALLESANFPLAERYFALAATLLATAEVGDDALRDKVDVKWHYALYSLGRLEETDQLYARMQVATTDPLELLEPTCVQMRSLDYRGRMRESLQLGEKLLGQLGVDIPAGYDDPQLSNHLAALQPWLEQESRGPAAQWPELRDPRALGIASLLARMVRSAYFLVDGKAFLWLLLESQRLWAAHGHCAPSGAILGRMGIGLVEDYKLGYDIARHVLNVSEAAGWEPETSEARFLFTCYFQHWFEPLEDSLPQVVQAREGVKACGDVPFASYMGLSACPVRLDCFAALDAVEAEVVEDAMLSKRVGHAHSQALLQIYLRLVRTLRGTPLMPGVLADTKIDDPAHIAGIEKLPIVQMLFDSTCSTAAAIFGDLRALERHVGTAFPLVEPDRKLACLPGAYLNALAYLFVVLLRAEQLRSEPHVDTAARRSELARCRSWMQMRAADQPANFRHLFHLMVAEEAWALGDIPGAAAAFDAAHHAARSVHRPWHRAFITERAARFQLSLGMRHTGMILMVQARDHYLAWGAMAKVHRLDLEFPELQSTSPGAESGSVAGTPRGSDRSADALDLMGVLRASQALSSETSMQRLTERVGEVLAALTGATGVTLLSRIDGQWSMLAQGPAGQPVQPLPVVTAAERGLVPLSAFSYAERTGQVLRIDDVAADDRFANDRYFSSRAHASMLLVPVAVHGTSGAMVLLENQRTRAAFGAGRLEAIMLIAGQLAVSLANVQLYESLEQRVQARTEDLRKMQAELVTTARRAGMAEIATNVLHNVGNVLNSVNVAASLLQTNAIASRAQGLQKVVALMRDRSTDLGELLWQDLKGRQLTHYLAELAIALEKERGHQIEELDGLSRNITHIKSIVRGQLVYSGVSSIVESVKIEDLLEEALQVSTAATGQSRMTVVREIEHVPALELDRQRLLQILVNLIANAGEAMDGMAEEARRLTLGASLPSWDGGTCLRITVRDTGHGIAPENLERVFSHGFTTKKGGHGFGLHSCALAAMEIGGKLLARSEGLGLGAEFVLDLPVPVQAANRLRSPTVIRQR